MDANASPGADTIAFNIAGTGVHTISPTSALPTITGPVSIDATTDDSFAANGNRPAIVLAGTNVGGVEHGLVLASGASGSTIRGLVVRDWGDDGIWIQADSNNNFIVGNYIGRINADGTAGAAGTQNDDNGVQVWGSNNTIGGSTAADRNVISGNDEGVTIEAGTGNLVIGNYIGTDATGTVDVGNFFNGVFIDNAASNIVGGTGAGERNLISGNDEAGIEILGTGSTGNRVLGNWIGLNAAGGALSNTWSGALLNSGASGNVIGGTAAGSGNVIANATGGDGIEVWNTNTVNNAFLGNSIYSNSERGIDLNDDGVTGNDVGDGDTGPNGLQNFPVISSATSVQAGTTLVGTLNSNVGTTYRVEFFSNRNNFGDGSNHGEAERYLGFTTVTTNGSGNASFNFTLAHAWVNSGDQVTATATVDLGGGNYGSTSEFAANRLATSTGIIVVDTTSDVSDGTTTSITDLGNARGADNRISLREAIAAANNTANSGGNPDKIVFAIPGTGTHTIAVTGALPNITQAVNLDASTDDSFNSNGDRPAIVLDGSDLYVNGLSIAASGDGTTVRGFVIRNFARHGIEIAFGADSNTIAGNYIGALNSDGTPAAAALGNGELGILVLGSNNLIGGVSAVDRNVIGGQISDDGIQIEGPGATGNQLVGNYIGVAADGVTALGNANSGIALFNAGFNTVRGNLLAYNAHFGVWINGSGNTVENNTLTANAGGIAGVGIGTGNSFSRNAIFGNIGLGIDLDWNGLTPNDAGDVDSGANGLQNFPVLFNAVSSAGNSTITGNFNSNAGTTYRIEFFSSPTADATGHGEGQTYLGFATVTTDGSGNATINTTLTGVSVPVGHVVSATATVDLGGGNYGSTSEFAANVTASGASNSAPTLGNGALPAVNEDTVSPAGASVSSIFSGQFSDPDSGASFGGIAIVGNTANVGTQGVWQYSSNGGTNWFAVGTVADGATALAVGSGSLIRFLPVANYNGSPTALTVRGLDDTHVAGYSTTVGSETRVQIDTTSRGGATPIAAANASLSTTITAVNDAPVLGFIGSIGMTATNEDTISAATLVSDILISALMTDVDAAAQRGIAVTSVTANGTFEYSTNGLSWTNFGAVSVGNALLLATGAQVRYTPDGANAEFASFVFRGWDQTSGPASANGAPLYANPGAGGGTSAFSAQTATVIEAVTAVNDAPVLSGANNLASINRNPVSNPGTRLSDLVAGQLGDVDVGAVTGVAVTAVVNTHGAWQYSTNGGGSWSAFGAPTVGSARLLLADASTFVRFVPNANWSGTVSNGLSLRGWDQTSGTVGNTADTGTNGGSTAFSTAVASASITVTASNTAPVLSGTNNLGAITEDPAVNAGTLVSALIAGQVTDADPAALSGIAVTAVDNTNGSWQYTLNGGGLWADFGTPSTAAARLLAADANTSVRFVPNTNWNGAVGSGISFRAWDQTSGVAGGTASVSSASTFVDNFTTAAYSNNAGSANWSSNWVESDDDGGGATAGNILVAGGELRVGPGSSGDNIYRQANLTGLGSATLSFDFNNALASGNPAIQARISADGGTTYSTLATFTRSLNTGSGSMSFDISAYASSSTRVQFLVSGNAGGPIYLALDNVRITAGASGGSTAFSAASASASITVNAVNDAPVASTSPSPLSYAESQAATAVDAGLTLNDVDNANLSGAIVSISANFVTGEDVLAFANQNGITGSWNGATGVLTLSGASSLANYQAALRSITYFNASANPSLATRTVAFVVNDGTDPSNTATRDIGLTAVNDAPVVATTGSALAYTENQAAIAIDPALTVSDADDANLSSATVSISANFVTGQDVLAFADQPGITGSWSAGTGVLSLTGVASVADYQTALRSITYLNTSDAPGIVARTVAFIVNDGAANSNTATRSIGVTAVNDAPTLGNGTLAAVNEDSANPAGQAVSTIFSGQFSDIDPGASLGGIVVVGNTADAGTQGVWQYSSNGGTNWFAIGTVADGATALAVSSSSLIRFVPVANYNGTPAALTVRGLDDTHVAGYSSTAGSETRVNVDTSSTGGNTAIAAAAATLSTAITALNDAPANAAPAGQYTAFNTPLMFSVANGNAISISDVDAGGASLQQTLAVGNGTLSLTTTAGLTITGGANGSAMLSFTGTVAAINAALDGLTYTPGASFRGLDTLQLITNDQGNSGSGGALPDTDGVRLFVGAIVVTNVNDVANGDTTSISALAATDGGDGISLREAITAANNTAGADTIFFSIAGTGAHTITPLTALPAITGTVVLDASTDDSFAANGDRPAVVIDGNDLAGDGLTLSATAGGSTLRGFVIRDFGGNGIRIDVGSSGNTIVGNWIGRLNADGTAAAAGEGNGAAGIYVAGSNNRIGGATAADLNVISGNLDGILITGASASANIVIGNYVGTGVDGTAALGNSGSGITISGAGSNSTIGGVAAGQGNVIANAGAAGIVLSGTGTGNAVLGNRIDGNAALGIDLGTVGVTANDTGDGDSGANDLQNFPLLATANSTSGSTTISGSFNSTASTNYRIEFFSSAIGNASGSGEGAVFLGFVNVTTDGSGDAGFAALLTGVTVAAGHVVSATATVDLGGGNYGSTSEFAANVMATNNTAGFSVGAISGNTSEAGGSATFSVALNTAPTSAVTIAVSSSNALEGTASTALLSFTSANWNVAQTVTVTGVDETVVDGNRAYSIVLAPAISADPAYSGQDPSDVALLNTDDDTQSTVVVTTTADTADGDTSSLYALLSNRGADGQISLREAITAANNSANGGGGVDRIHFNIAAALVGGAHTIDLLSALPGISEGVFIDASSEPDFLSAGGRPVVVINGLAAGAGASGLYLDVGASGSSVRGLVIQGFDSAGIAIPAGSNNHLLVGNYLGTDVSGMLARPNGRDGASPAISVFGDNNQIGGAGLADRNLISGNLSTGIRLSGSGNRVQGNFIGSDLSGAAPLPNVWANVGMALSGSGNLIGGAAAGEGNLLINNSYTGVIVNAPAAAGNAWLGNLIRGNAGLGIDLGNDGVTANDAGDADSGPNNLQNHPVLSSVNSALGDTTVVGTINSNPGRTLRIELFSTAAGAASGHGQAETYLGFTTVTTDGSGDASFAIVLPGLTVPSGHAVSAIATVDLGSGSFGDSSEFSAFVVASNSTPGFTVGPVSGNTTEAGATANFSVVLNTAPTSSVTVPLTVSNPREGGLSITTLVFTPFNWNTPQTVAVTGVDDTLADGNQSYTVNLGVATSADPAYSGLDPADRVFSNVDNDTVNTVVVTTTADVQDGDTSSLAALWADPGADGQVSLREAILAANNTPNAPAGADRIVFNIAEALVAGLHTINLLSALPALSQAVVIDGSTEPDFGGPGSTPVVILSGLGAGPGAVGLVFGAASGGSSLRNLGLDAFAAGGLSLQSSNNQLVDNAISNSGAAGVVVSGAAINNRLDGNRIWGHAGLGIDLRADAIRNPNDGVFNAGAANRGMDAPVLVFAGYGAGNLSLFGHVGSAPGQSAFGGALVQIFVAEPDASGAGQGRRLLGSLVTDASGNFNASMVVVGLTVGDIITATATDAAGNTSEFALNRVVTPPNQAPANTAPASATADEDLPLAFVGGLALSVSDADANLAGVRLTVQQGVLSVDLAGGAAIASGANGSATLTLTGSVVQINAALASLVYQPRLNYFGADALELRSTDVPGLSTTSVVSLTVNPVNDAPVITSHDGQGTVHLDLVEGQTAFSTVTHSDMDGGPGVYSINGGADAALFTVDSNSGALRFITAPDFETRLDANGDGIYLVQVQVSDGAGGTASQLFSITVLDRNEAPLTSAVDKRTAEDTALVLGLGDFAFNDPDAGAALAHVQIVRLPAAGVLTLDGVPVGLGQRITSAQLAADKLVFTPAADGNGEPYATLDFVVSDGLLDSARATLRLIVDPVNDAPRFTNLNPTGVTVFDVPPGSLSLMVLSAVDVDLPAQTLVFTLSGGPDAAQFELNPTTGELRFLVPADLRRPLDADADYVYELSVQVSDGARVEVRNLAVRVTPVTVTGPVITNGDGAPLLSLAVDENSLEVGTMAASHSQWPLPPLSFSLVPGDDAAAFQIDAVSGRLRFVQAPDFEAPADGNGDNLYQVTVAVSDGILQATQVWQVLVRPVNDNVPRIVSEGGVARAEIGVRENNSSVTQVRGQDADLPAQTLVYRIVGGADAALFRIAAGSGELQFAASPDHEAPSDQDRDNRYEVLVEVSDGAWHSQQLLGITVLPVNDSAPVFTSGGSERTVLLDVSEGTVGLFVARATDADSAQQPLAYSIVGGADAALFSIDPVSGALRFLQPPSSTAPRDAGGNGIYEVTLQASDGTLMALQSLRIAVSAVSTVAVLPPVIGAGSGAVPAPALPPERSPAAPQSPAATPGAPSGGSAGTSSSAGAGAAGGAGAGGGSAELPPNEEGSAEGSDGDTGRAGTEGAALRVVSGASGAAGPSVQDLFSGLQSAGSAEREGAQDANNSASVLARLLQWAVPSSAPVGTASGLNFNLDLDLDVRPVGLPAHTLAAQAAARSRTPEPGDLSLDRPSREQEERGLLRFEALATPSVAASLAFSATVLLWVTRAGGLMAAMVASVPAWRGFDPLPILQRKRGPTHRDDPDDLPEQEQPELANPSAIFADSALPPGHAAQPQRRTAPDLSPSGTEQAAQRELIEDLETW